jgi:carbamoyltransferase
VLGINASYHDTAAVIVRDGQVVAAVEEERLNRVKHTNALPLKAVDFCLNAASTSAREIDVVALNLSERHVRDKIHAAAYSQAVPRALSLEARFARWFGDPLGPILAPKVEYVPHHLAHAASAMLCSNFDEALVVSIDGIGDDELEGETPGMVLTARGAMFERLRTMHRTESLGYMYGQVTKLLGFEEFDEYKVMGLAPYGRPETHRQAFEDSYELTPDGWYRLDRIRLIERLLGIVPVRQKEAQIDLVHKDIAAACQEALETIVLHVLRHYRKMTGLRRLAMAGGVALNCALNGRILAAGLFEDIFVQPASHDAGGALGAALYVAARRKADLASSGRLTSVYWGNPSPPTHEIEGVLERWAPFLEWQRSNDIAALTANHLAKGSVVGWFQGRSEFGPRALGNRSILADPRPAENRDIVNRMVKQREAFRPFAPSVLAERLRDYFDVPDDRTDFPFMLFLLKVRPEYRERLGAITHVDGTARVQTVRRSTNPRYWDLIQRFGDATGMYVLLNTSFNNSAEPIVNSIEDAIVTYLTTGLNALVLDEFFVTKRSVTNDLLARCGLAVAESAVIATTLVGRQRLARWARYRDEVPLAARPPISIGGRTFEILCLADGSLSLESLLHATRGEDDATVLEEIRRLWSARLVEVRPPVAH